MSKLPNYNVADSVTQALVAGLGSSESTVEGQHVKAIAMLTAQTPNDPAEAAAINNAIALLNRNLAHVRDPRNK